jgi:hypothetical protein
VLLAAERQRADLPTLTPQQKMRGARTPHDVISERSRGN